MYNTIYNNSNEIITNIKSYLESRWIKASEIDKLIQAFNLKEIGKWFIIPMKDLQGIEVSEQTRLYNPKADMPKSISKKGSPRWYFFADVIDVNAPILIFEWEIDTLSAYSIGLKNIIGIPSANLLQKLVKHLLSMGAKAIYIAGDNDTASNKSISWLRSQLIKDNPHDLEKVFDSRMYLELSHKKDINELINIESLYNVIDYHYILKDAKPLNKESIIIKDLKEVYTYSDEKNRSRVDPLKVANYIYNKYDIIFNPDKSSYFVYDEDNRVWNEQVESYIAEIITQELDNVPFYIHDAKIHKLCLSALQVQALDSVSLNKILDQRNNVGSKIYFSDKILDLSDDSIKDIEKDDFITSKFEYKCDDILKAKEPIKFKKLINDMFPGPWIQCIANQDALQLFLWSTLIKNYEFNKALILYGDWSNGKWLLCDIMYKVLWSNNCKTINLKSLTEKFWVEQVKGYSLIIDPEAEHEFNWAHKNIKLLITQEQITTDVKFKKRETFQFNWRLLICTNHLWDFHSYGESVTRRFILLDWLPKIIREDNFASRLFEEESHGIFQYILWWARRIFNWEKLSRSVRDRLIEIKKEEMWYKDFVSSKIYRDLCDDNLASYWSNRKCWTSTLFKCRSAYCSIIDIPSENKLSFIKSFSSLYKLENIWKLKWQRWRDRLPQPMYREFEDEDVTA